MNKVLSSNEQGLGGKGRRLELKDTKSLRLEVPFDEPTGRSAHRLIWFDVFVVLNPVTKINRTQHWLPNSCKNSMSRNRGGGACGGGRRGGASGGGASGGRPGLGYVRYRRRADSSIEYTREEMPSDISMTGCNFLMTLIGFIKMECVTNRC